MLNNSLKSWACDERLKRHLVPFKYFTNICSWYFLQYDISYYYFPSNSTREQYFCKAIPRGHYLHRYIMFYWYPFTTGSVCCPSSCACLMKKTNFSRQFKKIYILLNFHFSPHSKRKNPPFKKWRFTNTKISY